MPVTLDNSATNASALATKWWVLVARGLAAILFGILVIARPRLGVISLEILLVTLALVWGSYALVDGLFNLILAGRGARAGRRWGWLFFEGAISILAGAFALAFPGSIAAGLLGILAVWAIVRGVSEVFTAIRLRHVIDDEWTLGAAGVLSIALGVLLVAIPAGWAAVALARVIFVYAVLFGLLYMALGVRLHRWDLEQHPLPTKP